MTSHSTAVPVLVLTLSLLGTLPVGATQIAVLVHGYLGDGMSWHRSGVVPQLEKRGWQGAGHWRSTRRGVELDARPAPPRSNRRYYTVDLPSTAPLAHQARFLGGMLISIAKQHPNAAIDLVGHSAGGVVARLALVNYGAGSVTRLTTIAAPHLGTRRAWQALEATDDRGLLGKVKRWFVKRKVGDETYEAVQKSRGALTDLGPPVPGSLLFWLNSQPHPDIVYVSIVRATGFGMPGDRIVPAPSQDMNQVPVLHGRANTLVVANGHLLRADDGELLARLLASDADRSPDNARQVAEQRGHFAYPF